MHLSQRLQHLSRVEHILKVFINHDFGHILVDLKLLKGISLINKLLIWMSHDKESAPTRLVHAFEELGPVFVKLGQLLSVRPDIIPHRYVEALEELQSNMPAMSFEEVREILESSYGKPIKKIFKSIDTTPIAAASIGQVHRATLNNGKKVAVKIRRSDAIQIFEQDIDIMKHLSQVMGRHPKYADLKPQEIIKEFEEWTRRELDFSFEQAQMQEFAHHYKKEKRLIIPKVYSRYCKDNVLVMEYIQGRALNNLDAPSKKHMKEVFAFIFENALNQFFEYGRFHADPHPGNILITKDYKVGLVDFGIIGELDQDLKEQTLYIFYYMLTNDPDGVLEHLLQMSVMDPQRTNIQEIKRAVQRALGELHKPDVAHIQVGPLLQDMIKTAVQNHVQIPRPFVLFAKSIVILEGIALSYDSSFNVVESALPTIERLIKQKMLSRGSMKELGVQLAKSSKDVLELPGHLTNVLRKFEEGSVKLNIKDTDILKLAVEIDSSSNRIAYAGIIGSLIIGGSLLMTIENFAFSFPGYIAAIFFVMAVFVGFLLYRSILLEKKMRDRRVRQN